MAAKKTMEIAVGLFVVAGIAAIGMLAFRVGNLASAEVTDPYRVEARFDNIGGLKVKAPVTMAGVRIGRVADIGFDSERYQAVVTLDIDSRYNRIPNDSNVSILTAGLLGEQYIGMEPGGAEEYLKQGDTIQLTQSALVLEKLISQFLFSKAQETPAGQPDGKPTP